MLYQISPVALGLARGFFEPKDVERGMHMLKCVNGKAGAWEHLEEGFQKSSLIARRVAKVKAFATPPQSRKGKKPVDPHHEQRARILARLAVEREICDYRTMLFTLASTFGTFNEASGEEIGKAIGMVGN